MDRVYQALPRHKSKIMSDSFPYLDIVLIAMFAAFVALRLRSVLGRRTGNERGPSEETQRRYSDSANADAPSDFPEGADQGMDAPVADYRMVLNPSSKAFDGIEAIRDADPGFDIDQFVAGARGAYDLILNAFWSGNLEDMKPFASPSVYQDFVDALSALEDEKQSLHNQLERVRKIEFRDASLEDGKRAEITLAFTSDVLLLVKDSEGRIIAGDPVDPAEIIDIWTFERMLDSDDPNWLLVATDSEG